MHGVNIYYASSHIFSVAYVWLRNNNNTTKTNNNAAISQNASITNHVLVDDAGNLVNYIGSVATVFILC